MIDWQIVPFEQLTLNQLYDVMKLRQDIFVVEQNCPYHDLDNLDQQCEHLMAFEDDQLIAYTRLIPKGIVHQDYSAIGRVIISQKARGRKLGYELMERSIAALRAQYPTVAIKIGAQQHLEDYYTKVGFRTISDMYLEDDIPHIDMLLDDQPAE